MKTPSVRQKKLEEGVALGKTPPQAAREAGFSESYSRVDVYKNLANPSVQERIERRRAKLMERANVRYEEIIGSLAEIATSSLADVLPEDEFLQRAKANGTDHLIKKIKRIVHKDGTTTYEYEMYSRLEALDQLADNLGLKKEPQKNPVDSAKEFLSALKERLPELSELDLFELSIKSKSQWKDLTAEMLGIEEVRENGEDRTRP